MLGLAAARHQGLQRLALGGVVAGFIGAAHQQFQGGVTRIHAEIGADIALATGEIARQVIGLGHHLAGRAVQSARLAQGLAAGDHILVLAGVIIVGELGLETGGATQRGVARHHADRLLHLGDDAVIVGGTARNGLGLGDLGQRALVILGIGQTAGFRQRGADARADRGLRLGGGGHHQSGRRGRGGAKENRRQGGMQFTRSHNKTSFASSLEREKACGDAARF